jgi:hypothetical protein
MSLLDSCQNGGGSARIFVALFCHARWTRIVALVRVQTLESGRPVCETPAISEEHTTAGVTIPSKHFDDVQECRLSGADSTMALPGYKYDRLRF